jgi:phage N-6-adenine-methyltransferase
MADGAIAVASGPTIRRHKSKQDYGTPADFLAVVTERFGELKFDLAASPENAKAQKFFTSKDNALKQEWPRRVLCWLNPPFDRVDKWAAKCAAEAAKGSRILFLVPASVGANWYWESVAPHAVVYAVTPRLQFDGYRNKRTGKPEPYPKDLILAAYGFGVTGFSRWPWKAPRTRKGKR